MGTKTDPGTYNCLAEAGPNEELFILLARDPLAASLVNLWAIGRQQMSQAGVKPTAEQKLLEAMDCAARMRHQCVELGRTPANLLEWLPTSMLRAELSRRVGINASVSVNGLVLAASLASPVSPPQTPQPSQHGG